MQTWQLTSLELIIPLAFSELVIVIDFDFGPILFEVGIRITAFAEEIHLVQILDQDEVTPAFRITEGFEFVECELK